MSADRAAFLQTILENPDDDTARLIFADWLEEQGESERATLIRVQCELARLPADNPRHPQYADWKATEHALLQAHAKTWAAPLAGLVGGWEFQRGFIDVVTMPATAFLAQGEVLFQLAPVTHVRFLEGAQVLPELAACPNLARLRTLQLSANYLDDAALGTLAHSPHLGQLTALHLGRNNFTNRGAVHLAQASGLPRLRQLNLSHNFIGTAGARQLAFSRQLATLSTLDISNNLVDREGLVALRQRFGDNLAWFGQGHVKQVRELESFLERMGVPFGTAGYAEEPLERLEQWLNRQPG